MPTTVGCDTWVVFYLFLSCLPSALGKKSYYPRLRKGQPVLAESRVGVRFQTVIYTLEKISDMLHSDLLSAKLFSAILSVARYTLYIIDKKKSSQNKKTLQIFHKVV